MTGVHQRYWQTHRQTDRQTDRRIWTCLRSYLVSVFFLVSVIVISFLFSFFWSQASISLITVGFWIFDVLYNSNCTSISVSLISFPFKTCVLFSLCARLNGQLACQFSSANHAPYHIRWQTTYTGITRPCNSTLRVEIQQHTQTVSFQWNFESKQKTAPILLRVQYKMLVTEVSFRDGRKHASC